MGSTLPTSEAPDLPSPPFITVPGIHNFRDIGGYPISSSSNHSVRSNILYRCADPSKITEDGVTVAQELGITHVYDLRSNNEIERNKAAGRGGVVQWEGCKRVFAPVFEDRDYSPEALASRFKDYASGGPEVCSLRKKLYCHRSFANITCLGIHTCIFRDPERRTKVLQNHSIASCIRAREASDRSLYSRKG